jgi:hypothetical protein
MKVNAVNLLVAVAVSMLLTYGIMSIDANTMKATIGIGTFITLACTLGLAIGFSIDDERVGANLRVVATVFFLGALLLNVAFAFAGLSQTSYIISAGVLFLVYVLIANALFGAKH